MVNCGRSVSHRSQVVIRRPKAGISEPSYQCNETIVVFRHKAGFVAATGRLTNLATTIHGTVPRLAFRRVPLDGVTTIIVPT